MVGFEVEISGFGWRLKDKVYLANILWKSVDRSSDLSSNINSILSVRQTLLKHSYNHTVVFIYQLFEILRVFRNYFFI